MRSRSFFKTAAFLLAVATLSAPALAEENGVSFGGDTCGPTFSCSAFSSMDADSAQISKLVALANTCLHQNFGYHGEDAFEEGGGLDYNRCLRARPVKKAKQGFTITPSCCLVQTGEDDCHLVCQFVGTK